MTDRFVDLHVHTNFSDSTFSVEEVVSCALKNNLSAIAITDHDCIDAIQPGLDLTHKTGLEVIPGVELTAQIGDTEVHILGLLIEWNNAAFKEKLKLIRQSRFVRMEKMIKNLNLCGIKITMEEVSEMGKLDVSIGRLHLARTLLKKNAVFSIKEAFNKYIGEGRSCYVTRFRMTPQEAIYMIKELKGIPIMAHPGTMSLDEFIPSLVDSGLMGIEVYHTEHNKSTVSFYKKLAKNMGLLISGGSDCHGEGKGYPLIGTVKVPYEVLENLKEAKKRTYGG